LFWRGEWRIWGQGGLLRIPSRPGLEDWCPLRPGLEEGGWGQ